MIILLVAFLAGCLFGMELMDLAWKSFAKRHRMMIRSNGEYLIKFYKK